MKRVCLCAVVLSVTFLGYAQSVEEFEPNNDVALASLSVLGAEHAGHMEVTYDGGTLVVDDAVDWWTFSIPEDGTLQIELSANSVNERGNGIGGAVYGAGGDPHLIESISGMGWGDANNGWRPPR